MWVEIVDKIERSARNRTKLHLTNAEVWAIIASPAYPLIQAEARNELLAAAPASARTAVAPRVNSWGDEIID